MRKKRERSTSQGRQTGDQRVETGQEQRGDEKRVGRRGEGGEERVMKGRRGLHPETDRQSFEEAEEEAAEEEGG